MICSRLRTPSVPKKLIVMLLRSINLDKNLSRFIVLENIASYFILYIFHGTEGVKLNQCNLYKFIFVSSLLSKFKA